MKFAHPRIIGRGGNLCEHNSATVRDVYGRPTVQHDYEEAVELLGVFHPETGEITDLTISPIKLEAALRAAISHAERAARGGRNR